MRHYITRYQEDGVLYAEAWLQIDLFGKSFCFWRVKQVIAAIATPKEG